MRTRTKDETISVPTKWRWGSTISNPNPVFSTGSYVKGSISSMADVVTPRFRELQAKGMVINNPYSCVKETWDQTFGPYMLSAPRLPSGDRDFGDLTQTVFPNVDLRAELAYVKSANGIPGDHTNVLYRVGTSALANVARADYSGAVSLGELRETIAYLRNPLKTALSLATAIERKLSKRVLRGGKWEPGLLAKTVHQRKSKSISEELSSLHLEMMYGLRPLVKEVSDFAEMVTFKRRESRPKRETSRSSETVSWGGTVTSTSAQSGISFTKSSTVKSDVVVRAGCMYHFDDYLDVDSSRDWGVRLSDVPSALWALTPSSFVADWFLNINQYIQAMTPIHGLRRDAEWTTVIETDYLTVRMSGFYITATPTYVGSGSVTATYRVIRKSRIPQLYIGVVPTRVSSGITELTLGQTSSLMSMAVQRLVPLIRDLGESSKLARSLHLGS